MEKPEFDAFLKKYPHPHRTFFDRPHFTRRHLFEVVGAGITGATLVGRATAAEVSAQASVTTINQAKNVIFILLAGAPSHTDTFDLKMVNGITPADFNPAEVSGLQWPTGLLPKLAGKLPDIAIVRSMRAWALVHNLAQTWTQIGRNPAAALGDIAPNIGSIVAIEKQAERTPGQAFPTFLALNSPQGVGPGYLPSTYAPFKTLPAANGLANTTNPDGAVRLDGRYSLLHSLDDPLRVNSPLGRPLQDMDDFYKAAKQMTYNPAVDKAFKFTAAESARYGSSPLGNACLVAKQVLDANQGTRFIQITAGGWDMHQDIYDKVRNPRGNLYVLGGQMDAAVASLLDDLKSSGLLAGTMVVMVGEFGRTVGGLSAQNGRDHYLQQFCMFAGAGIRGGRAIGSTDARGAFTADPGWSQKRDIRPEDVEATIYSALGINWTNIRYDDPFHRGFEYVPGGSEGVYSPIQELWS
ncbi:MAG TPA: DUF1501 domain-containing protein [Bryobacteraceae bacterium]|nr:DUF1501 domain-containing protein [Bryobacteraceae bacterium]